MAKFVGSGKLKVNGMQLGTVPNTIEVMLGGMQRSSQIADGVFHSNETPVQGSIKAEFLWTDKFPFKTINELRDAVIEVELDIGTKFEMQSAERTGDPLSATTSDGRVKAEFAGTITLK